MLTKGINTQVKIIETATDLFFELGLYEVTYQKIAQSIGVTQPAIYRHFKTMDELFLACCKHWDDQARQRLYNVSEEMDPATVQLRRYVERHFTYSKNHRAHDSLMFGLYYYSMRSKPILSYYQLTTTKAIDNVERILKFGNVDQSWHLEETRRYADLIHSLIAGEIFKFLVEPKKMKIEDRAESVLAAIEKVLAF